ncbi:hypothetical protein F2P81_001314 [Scophthalmus maximus]|uniref:Uncharacterized protein n=1 Tax=Scophthalmus maximus TaxID=52904 RepID=A0A6A4TYV8_SCOMX|nr:hypothetical protein F2P81_001314 [Scophthalmus maximus]
MIAVNRQHLHNRQHHGQRTGIVSTTVSFNTAPSYMGDEVLLFPNSEPLALGPVPSKQYPHRLMNSKFIFQVKVLVMAPHVVH